jgi:hypothetical protein
MKRAARVNIFLSPRSTGSLFFRCSQFFLGTLFLRRSAYSGLIERRYTHSAVNTAIGILFIGLTRKSTAWGTQP